MANNSKIISRCLIICRYLAILGVFAVFFVPAEAQQPSPGGGGIVVAPPKESKLSEYIDEATIQSISFKQSLVKTFEQPMVGWFIYLSYYLAFIIFLYLIAKKTFNGELDPKELKRTTVILVFCFLGLIWSGDVDGDGRKGDLVTNLQKLGNSLAYGISKSSPEGNWLNKEVNEQRVKFDENYEKFVENKMMVKVDSVDMPVQYPGMEGLQKLAALYTGRPLTEDEVRDVTSEAKWMGYLFELLGWSRWIAEGIDFLLFYIVFLALMSVRLFLPFCFAIVPEPNLAKRISFPFLWSSFTLTVVAPIIAQICRLLIFMSGNIGLGQSSSNPHFSFDVTTNTIVANGNPQWTIIMASISMLLSIALLAFSLIISYKLMQGALVEGITGLATQVFGMGVSTGLGIVVNMAANNLSQQADRISADASYESAKTSADFSLQSQNASAQSAYDSSKVIAGSTLSAENVMSQATANASRQSAFGTLSSGMQNLNAEKYEKSATALADLNQNFANLSSEQKRESALNALDLVTKNNDLFTREGQQRIKDEVEKLNLPGDQLNQALNMIPVVGSGLKTLGINGEALNPMLNTDAGKAVLGAMISAGSNGGVPTVTGQMMAQSLIEGYDTSKGLPALTKAPENSGLGTYTQDGAVFDQSKLPFEQNQAVTTGTPINPSTGLTKAPSNFSSLPVPRMSRVQQKNLGNLQSLMNRDPQFLPAVQSMCRRNGWNTNDALNLMALETADTFDPGIIGGAGGNYVGLIQFGKAARQDVGLPADVNQASNYLRSIKPSQQVPYIEKYMKAHEKASGTKLDSVGKMYAAVGGGGGGLKRAMRNDGVVFSANSNDPANRSGYNANKNGWDVNNDKKITIADYGKASMDRLGAGVFFDANQATNSLRLYDPVTRKVMAAKFDRELGLARGLQNNQLSAEGKENINSAYYSEKGAAMMDRYDATQVINANVSNMKARALQDNYNWSVSASDTILSGSRQSAFIRNEGSLKSAEITFAGAKKSAELSHTGQLAASQIQHDAAIKSLNMRALSNGVSQIGNSLSHAASELIERSSRL